MTKARSNAVANAAKGDLTVGNGTNLSGILAVGNNGETLVADSSTSTGLRYGANFAAGKNKIINGNFGIWQRGTSFSNPANGSFQADRWSVVWDGTGATRTISRQTFPTGNVIPGYEFNYFYRFAQSVAGSGASYNLFQNRIEDVTTYAGQTVTISFWAKAAANTNLVDLNLEQDFGTGGSPSATVSNSISPGTITVTTSWQRFSYTTTVPSISGKTIGTTTPGYLGFRVWVPINATFTLDFVGFQIEPGSVATAFQTASGSIQGELALCQRYYFRTTDDSTADSMGLFGVATGTTAVLASVTFPVSMRVQPSSLDFANLRVYDGNNVYAVTNLTLSAPSPQVGQVVVTVASGLTSSRAYFIIGASGNGYIGYSAEF
jgi:hypothetical protein